MNGSGKALDSSDGTSPSEAYEKWLKSPGPKTLTPLVKSLDPAINSALRAYGYQDDPNMRGAAQRQIISSLPRYNPKLADIKTFAFNELKRLQRIGPKQQFAIPIPERAMLDLRTVNKAEHEMTYDLGREPTADELSDATGVSAKRIEQLRERYAIPSVTDLTSGSVSHARMDEYDPNERLWMEAVYSGLDPADKNIVDWTMGWHGKPVITKTEMAKRLNISVAAVSQRAKRLSGVLAEGQDYQVI